jgi:hypothetical protein
MSGHRNSRRVAAPTDAVLQPARANVDSMHRRLQPRQVLEIMTPHAELDVTVVSD